MTDITNTVRPRWIWLRKLPYQQEKLEDQIPAWAPALTPEGRERYLKLWNSRRSTTDTIHAYGIWWHKAPRPFFLHKHVVWTQGWIGFSRYDRCPCGAIRNNTGRWHKS